MFKTSLIFTGIESALQAIFWRRTISIIRLYKRCWPRSFGSKQIFS